MIIVINHIKKALVLIFIFSLVFFSSFIKIFAEEINWKEVANTNNEIQLIDTDSIKYNNKGLLSVVTKSSKIDPDSQKNINTNSYLIAIDCEKRLFSKLPSNGDPNQVKKWIKPVNDKLIKTTIINSCLY